MKTKNSISLIMLCIFFVSIVGCIGPQNIRQTVGVEDVDSGRNLTFMTFNIRAGGGIENPGMSPYDVTSSRENLEKIASAIKSVDPDVIALQEVRGYNQAKFIAETLNLNYAYSSHGGYKDWWGLAVLSKFRIIKVKSKMIHYDPDPRVGQASTIEINGEPITFVNVHYHLGEYEQQVKATVRLLKNAIGPIVLMGDLNLYISDPKMKPIRKALVDTCLAINTDGSKSVKSIGTGFGRIDYIFVDTKSFEVKDVGLVARKHWSASDHIAYFACVNFDDQSKRLESIRSRQKIIVPRLITALSNNDKSVRINAIIELGNIGSEARDAIPKLIKALKDNDYLIRVEAVKTLGKIGPETEDVVPALEKAMNEDNHDLVVLHALRALGEINRWREQ